MNTVKKRKIPVSIPGETIEKVANKILKVCQDEGLTAGESLAIINMTGNFITKKYGVKVKVPLSQEILEKDPNAKVEALQTQ